MRGKKIKCPACSEAMTVPGDAAARVTCPHCRSVVTLPGAPKEVPAISKLTAIDFPSGEPDLAKARDLLGQILQQTQLRQTALDEASAELKMLQARAGSLRQWLEESAATDSPKWSDLIFQSRLLARLASAPKGMLEIVETGAPHENSLAATVRDTFTAVGWQVECNRSPDSPLADKRPVFSVGPGPMSDQVATAHLALTLAGLPLQSVVNHDQADHAILILPGAVFATPAATESAQASDLPEPKFFPGKMSPSAPAAVARLLAV